MQLTNETEWDTIDLKRLCNAVIKHCGTQDKDHHILVKYQRGWTAGRAWYNSNRIMMYVHRLQDRKFKCWIAGSDGRNRAEYEYSPHNFDCASFAGTLMHEIAHNLNVHHKDMRIDYDVAKKLAEGMVVRPKEIKPKPKADVKTIRYNQAKLKVKEIDSKLRRYNNLLKKWKRKVKYYERNKEIKNEK